MKIHAFALGVPAGVLSLALCFPGFVHAEGKPRDTLTCTEAAGLLHDSAVERNGIESALAPIKSKAQLERYIGNTPKDESPLGKLSPGAQSRFIESLTFNDKGLTGFNYEDLQAELSASEIYAVLGLFGAQHDAALIKGAKIVTPLDQKIMQPTLGGCPCPSPCSCPPGEDHQGYSCTGDHSRKRDSGHVCMSSCQV